MIEMVLLGAALAFGTPVVATAEEARDGTAPAVLRTDRHRLSVREHCPEGEVGCADLSAELVDLRTGATLPLTGRTRIVRCADGVTPCHVGAYEFESGDVSVRATPDGQLELRRADGIVERAHGQWAHDAAGLHAPADALLSPREYWGRDFTDRAPPTAACPGGSLAALRGAMSIQDVDASSGANELPAAVRAGLAAEDRVHRFLFSTDPDAPGYWGFSGVLVARGDCILHAAVTGYDN